MENDKDVPERTQNCALNGQRLSNLEEGMKRVMKDISILRDQDANQNTLLAKFDLMLTIMSEDKKEQKENNREFIGTLKNINDNLTVLNSDVGNVKKDIESLRSDQKDLKDKHNKSTERTKIDWVDLATTAIKNIVTVGVGAGIVYLLSTLIK